MREMNNIPGNVCIRLNRKCNLSCSFCLASKESDELDICQIKKALDYFKANGLKKACLAGGEPTLRMDLIEIIDYCVSIGLKPVLYSNLIEIDHLIDDLAKYPISVTTSIHGNREYHDSVVRQGAYETTYHNIIELIERNVPVAIHTVAMQNNICFAEEIINTAIKIGVCKVTFQTLIPRGNGIKYFSHGEEPDEIIRNLVKLYPLKEKYKDDMKIKFINFYNKDYCVFETDGCLYYQREREEKDVFLQRIV